MTKQKYINLLISTSEAGGFPAMENNFCKYRCNNGQKCVLGLLIPDQDYTAEMEGSQLTTLKNKGLFNTNWLPEGVTEDNICKIQKYHDDIGTSGAIWDNNKFVLFLNTIFPANQVSVANL